MTAAEQHFRKKPVVVTAAQLEARVAHADDSCIERVAEWLYQYAFAASPGNPPPWDQVWDQQPYRDDARDLLAAIDGEADDE